MGGITIVSMAYWGDVMPFVPIGNELAARGHDVTFAVPEGFHELMDNERFALAPAGVQFSPRELAAGGRFVGRASSWMGSVRSGRFWLGQLVEHQADIHDALMRATEHADLVLAHPTIAAFARTVPEVRGLPWVTGHLHPMILPSDHHLPFASASRSGRSPSVPIARLSWKLATAVSAVSLYDRRINRFRRSLGLAPFHGNAAVGGHSPTDVLVLSSPRYTPVMPDWPPRIRTTGFTVWEGPSGRGLPEDLDVHLDAGEPPVLVTLGTAAATNADELLTMLTGIIDRIGVRAVFLVGDAATSLPVLRDRGDAWAFAPLPATLRRCRAVIHAGGHGTTAAVLTAGLPSVVLPQLVDQRWHGERVRTLGLGLHLPRWRGRETAIEAAVRRVLTDQSFTRRAEAMAEQLATEDGPAAAADAIEARLADPHPGR
jgi:rhamnosyltransferase subunit B